MIVWNVKQKSKGNAQKRTRSVLAKRGVGVFRRSLLPDFILYMLGYKGTPILAKVV